MADLRYERGIVVYTQPHIFASLPTGRAGHLAEKFSLPENRQLEVEALLPLALGTCSVLIVV